MKIQFARQPVRFSPGGIVFDAWVDDKLIVCEISSEALIEQFGASPSRTGCLIAFNAHRAEIETVAARSMSHRLTNGRCSIFCRDFRGSGAAFP